MSLVSPASAPPAGIRANAYLPEVEALRGIAVLLVYAFHTDRFLTIPLELAGTDTRAAVVSPLVAFVRSGHTGVSLFFVLSGFLLSLPFLAEAAGGPHVGRWRYAERRALRILPLYAFLLVVAVLATGSGWWRGAVYLVFANGFTPRPPVMPPWTNVVWSLATEAQYYVLLPLLPLAMRSRFGVALLALYAATWGAWVAGWLPPHSGLEAFRLAHSVVGRGWTFLAGIAVAWVYRTHGPALRDWAARIPWLRRGGSDALLGVVVLAQGVLLLWVLRQPKELIFVPPLMLWHVPEAVGWGLVLMIVLLAPLRTKALLCNPILVGIGVLSYSIYLWHVPVLHFGLRPVSAWWGASPQGWNGAGVVVFAILSVVVLAGSMLTYFAIERPFLRRKARLGV